jgi:hypothetical protein
VNSGDLVWQFGLLLLGLLTAAVVVLVMGHYMKRRSSEGTSTRVFRDLDPNDLSKLKNKGLLTDEEAKRLQAVITRKTLESMEKKSQLTEKRLDVQDLLSEVERLRLRHLQERTEPPEDKG